MTECEHPDVETEHMENAGREVSFWLTCPDCGAYFTVAADLVDETAHVSREREGADR